MTDAPERIWINGLGVYGDRADFGGVEYIRADKVAALVEALTEITETPARRYQQKIARAALAAFKKEVLND
jgi:hypothetical protein